MFCNYCGKNIQDDARVCAYCGRLVLGSAVPRRLERSIYDRKIAGVAGGMARYWSSDPTLIRLLWIFAVLCTFPIAIIAYIIAWIIVPEEVQVVCAHQAVVQSPPVA